jgi:hypothetical protein
VVPAISHECFIIRQPWFEISTLCHRDTIQQKQGTAISIIHLEQRNMIAPTVMTGAFHSNHVKLKSMLILQPHVVANDAFRVGLG